MTNQEINKLRKQETLKLQNEFSSDKFKKVSDRELKISLYKSHLSRLKTL
tara:strand:- start:485 stop:634 length:150 start_codon:yes stop_codon:yes gene_type:complete